MVNFFNIIYEYSWFVVNVSFVDRGLLMILFLKFYNKISLNNKMQIVLG